MIRFAHPFGAVLRTFSALRATSGLRRNDDEAISRSRAYMHIAIPFACAKLTRKKSPLADEIERFTFVLRFTQVKRSHIWD